MPKHYARRVLIAGAGALGQRIALALPGNTHISLIRRSAAVAKLADNIHWFQGDLQRASGFVEAIAKPDTVIFCASPDSRTESNYRKLYIEALGALIQAFPSARFLLCASTAIYSTTNWESVDQIPEALNEHSEAKPDAFNGCVLLEAEKLLRLGDSSIRLGGIYGPNRNYLLKLAQAGEPVLRKPGIFSNRIHIDDAARVIAKLALLKDPPAVVNLIDHTPCPQFEVLDYLCQQRDWLLLPERAPVLGESIGKRVTSKFHDQAWYTLEYPSYLEGYKQ